MGLIEVLLVQWSISVDERFSEGEKSMNVICYTKEKRRFLHQN